LLRRPEALFGLTLSHPESERPEFQGVLEGTYAGDQIMTDKKAILAAAVVASFLALGACGTLTGAAVGGAAGAAIGNNTGDGNAERGAAIGAAAGAIAGTVADH
jgi:osmotically inducible lipoprotein OsmB